MNERYQRHIQLKEVGLEGQEKLSSAKVIVIGAGGLGCPILQYLAAAGVGTIGIVDFDKVTKTNLQRQILYSENDLGQNKALCAQKKLQQLNSEIHIEAFPIALNPENALELLRDFDIVVDGSDNFETRYLINDACLILNKPMVYGALYKFEGQVSVFNYQEGPSYRCLFPKPPKSGEVPNCSDIGILGVLPGIIGVLQATEVIKIIIGIGEVLSGKILHYNALDHHQQMIEFKKNEREVKTILNNNKLVLIATQDCHFEESISLQDISSEESILWIDVREKDELPTLTSSKVQQFPLSELLQHLNRLRNEQQKIFFCQSGVRSITAVKQLQEQGIQNCLSLKEGAIALEQYLKNHT